MTRFNLTSALSLLVAFVASAFGLPVNAAIIGATTTTTDLDSALKIIFSEPIVNNVVRETELVDIFEEGGGIKTDITTGGRYIETAQMFGLPSGVGARGENGYIPVPRGPTIENSRIELKKVIGSVEMTGDVLKRVRTSRGAFLDWSERAMPSLVEHLNHEIDRMMLGYGAGIKARVNDATPATDLVIDSSYGVADYGGPTYQFLRGQSLRAGPNADGTSLRTGAMIVEAIDHGANTITVDALATSLADDDYIFEGDAADNGAGLEFMGLLGIVDDGNILATFQNIARSSYPEWQGNVFDPASITGFAGTDVLTEDLVTYADDETYLNGGGMIDCLVAHRAAIRAFWKDLRADRVINDPRSYTGGKNQTSMFLGDREVEIRSVRKIPPTVCYGLTKSTLKKFMLRRFEWDDSTGALFRQVTDSTGRKDAFYAYGTLHMEFACTDPQKNFRIEGFALNAS